MLNLADLNNEEASLFEDFYNQLAKQFSVSVEDDLNLPLQHFEMFRLCSNLAYEQAIKIYENNGKGYMLIIQVEIPYGYRSKYIPLTHLEFQAWGIVLLPGQFGHIFIKREVFKDRIVEFFHPLEINFPEDRPVSDKFYILAKDEGKALPLFNDRFRELLLKLNSPRVQIEVLDNLLLVGNSTQLGIEDVTNIAEFVKEVCNVHY